jgi:hypothetical protein
MLSLRITKSPKLAKFCARADKPYTRHALHDAYLTNFGKDARHATKLRHALGQTYECYIVNYIMPVLTENSILTPSSEVHS